MDREPLVVVMLRIPFKLAVGIKEAASAALGKALVAVFTFVILLMTAVDFRKSVGMLLFSGLLKVLLMIAMVYSSSYPIYWGVSYILLSDYPYLSIPLILAEVISVVYLLKKSSNSVSKPQKEKLKQLVETGIKDFAALLLTIVIIATVIAVPQLFNYRKPDEYLWTCYKAVKYLIINILLIPKLIILLPVPWRIVILLMNYDENKTGFKDIFDQLWEGLYDILAAVCLLVVCVLMIEVRSVWFKYRKNRLTRAGIIKALGLSFVDYLIITLALITVICMFRTYSLYCSCFDRDGKFVGKKEMAKQIVINFIDTLYSVLYSLVYLFLLMFLYRVRKIKVSFADMLRSSTQFWNFNQSCIEQAKIQLLDFFFGFLLLITLPFFYRSIKTIKKIFTGKAANWHDLTADQFLRTILDIPSILILIVIFLTLIRIPLLRRRASMYRDLHVFYLCSDIFSELLKDTLVIPFVIVNLLTPWRFYTHLPKLVAASSPKEQRKILKSDGLRPVEDYVTIFLSIILILSIWRTVEIISIIVTHIRQLLNNEQVTSSLFRKVFRKFLELIIDVFMASMILCIFLMCIEVVNFVRRMRMFYYLYKDRKGFQYKKYLDSIWPKKQVVEQTKSPTRRLNRNVFTNIAAFLDVKTLAEVAKVNKQFKNLVGFPPVWKFLYENQWKKHINAAAINELSMGDDYKELVRRGFENFTKENSGIILDEPERDYKMGARVIVLEEFVLSIFGFPHIIALPAKIICYLLAKIELEWYFAAPRYPRLGFQVWIGTSRIDQIYASASTELRPSPDTLKSFYHIQLNFVFLIMRISIILFEQIAFLLCYFDFLLLKLGSFWNFRPLLQPGAAARVANMSLFVYFIQLLIAIAMVLLKLLIAISPIIFTYKFTDYNWLWMILGPFCIFIPFYVSIICNISTVVHYLEKFHNFNPHFSWRLALSAYTGCVGLGRWLFDILKPKAKSFYQFLVSLFSSLKLLLPKGTLFILYKEILIKSGRILKAQGYLGDLIFTPLTLLWIFWPLLIPYYLQEYYLLIPIFPIEIFLIIKGYSTAKLAWSNPY